MKVRVDKQLCTGCELCAQTCPEVFRMEEDTAIVYVGVVPEEAETACKEAVEDCPVEAILVIED
jgi:ferredoxin